MDSSQPPDLKSLAAIPPHLVLRDFLGAVLVDALLDLVEERAALLRPSRIGVDLTTDPTIRRSLETRDLGALRDDLAARFGAARAPALAAFGMADFTPDRIDLQLAAHGDGAFYARHIDTLVKAERASARVLTGVYYFHALPRRFTGGALRLHSILPLARGGRYADIAPDNDTLLLFPSWAPHEVMPVACPTDDIRAARFAINCWFHRAM